MKKELLEQLTSITKEEQEILDGRTTIDVSLYNSHESMVIDSQRLLDDGKLIDLRTHTRFVKFPKHTHNYIEVVYMCSGQTHHIINGTELELHTGELLFLSQNSTQEIQPAGANDIAVNLIILPEFFDQVLAIIGVQNSLLRDFLVDCLRNSHEGISYLYFKVADVLPVQNLMENMIDLLLHPQNNKRKISQTTMALLFLHLMNCTDYLEIGKDHLDQELTLTVFRFIEENYRSGELSQLADSLHYSLYQLSRIIKHTTGKTYTELLQEKRLQQAAFLLSTTTLSVMDVCLSVGYNNFSYFYRIFRQRYQMTPKAYRRENGL